MEYRSGYTIKPNQILRSGQVIFTDGTNEITPTQAACEAYGYTFDTATRTCVAYPYSTQLEPAISNENNIVRGNKNITKSATTNTTIMGEGNISQGNNRNNIIIGSNNEIANGVNNAFVYGTKAEITTGNTITLGGNAGSDDLGERQTMTFMYGATSTDNSTKDSYLNNTVGSYFVVPTDTAVYFQSETLAVRVAGSEVAGAIGDFKSWVERGVVINKSGTLSIDRSRTSPADSGTTTGWSPINSVSGTNFLQTIKGANNMTIEWVSTIRITQIKTGVAL